MRGLARERMWEGVWKTARGTVVTSRCTNQPLEPESHFSKIECSLRCLLPKERMYVGITCGFIFALCLVRDILCVYSIDGVATRGLRISI